MNSRNEPYNQKLFYKGFFNIIYIIKLNSWYQNIISWVLESKQDCKLRNFLLILFKNPNLESVITTSIMNLLDIKKNIIFIFNKKENLEKFEKYF